MGLDVEEGRKPLQLPGATEPPGKIKASKAPERAGRGDCLLAFFRLINIITICCAALCMVADCMALVGKGKPQDIAAAIRQALRVYSIILGSLIILTETEWDRFLSLFRALDGWVIRGLLQLFEAGLTLELARASGASDFHRSTQLYRVVAGASLSGCGSFYVLGGILCVGRLKRARYKRTAELVKVQHELDSVDRRRGELRSLLAVYSDEQCYCDEEEEEEIYYVHTASKGL